MAEIDIQRKSGTSWIWWALGLLVLALIVWWIVSAADDEAVVAEAPGVVAPVTPEPVATAAGVSIADVLGNPTAYVGQPFTSSSVRVAEVVSDRGFYIEDNGARLFTIIVDQPTETPNVNAGQMLSISEGVLRDRAYLPQIAGAPLDAETQRIAESQPLFLVADEDDVTITQGGM